MKLYNGRLSRACDSHTGHCVPAGGSATASGSGDAKSFLGSCDPVTTCCFTNVPAWAPGQTLTCSATEVCTLEFVIQREAR